MHALGNSLLAWSRAAAIALGALLLLLLVRRLVRGSVRGRISQPAVRPPGIHFEALKLLAGTNSLFLLAVALFAGLSTLAMTAREARVLEAAIKVALFWQIGLWASAASMAWLERKRSGAAGIAVQRPGAGSLTVVGFLLQAAIWGLVTLLALANLGVDVTALIAGLGVGGVAVALAMQNILGDLFASLSITFDRPFVVGESLAVDSFIGSVEHIGIRSTRLRSISGEQLVISNADLLKSRLRNFGRMSERRVVFTVGVTYETPADRLERLPGAVRRIVEQQQGVRFERCHFAKFSEASLDFETVYYVLSADYGRYMDIQQAINLGLHREFERLGVEFAYPTQRLLLERPPRPEGRAPDDARRG